MTYPLGLDQAIIYATLKHAGQVDKAGVPYIFHPLAVAGSAKNDRQRIAAVLHDTVEDTSATFDEIERLFGSAARSDVEYLTRRNDETYDEFIDRVCSAPDADPVVVKLLDVGHNLSRMANLPTDVAVRLTDKYLRARDELEVRIRRGYALNRGEP